MRAVTTLRDRDLLEIAPAVAVKDPNVGAWVIDGFRPIRPFSHFRAKDIEIAVTVDVADTQAMPVDKVFFKKVMRRP